MLLYYLNDFQNLIDLMAYDSLHRTNAQDDIITKIPIQIDVEVRRLYNLLNSAYGSNVWKNSYLPKDQKVIGIAVIIWKVSLMIGEKELIARLQQSSIQLKITFLWKLNS